MKKIILSLLLISFLTLPGMGLATVPGLPPAPPAPIDPIWAIRTITNILFGLLALVAVIVIIIGAFNLLAAGGDATKIDTGKKQILYALIAVIVAVLAWGAVDFIIRQFVR